MPRFSPRRWIVRTRPTQAWRRSVLLLAIAIAASQVCRAEAAWPLWQHYSAHFLESSGRIVDHSDADRSTSEGQAYGMFFALIANDKQSFDKMLRWTEDNLAAGDLTARLPAWKWGKSGSGEWRPLDPNSAADADLWLAYDCLEGGRLWDDDRLTKLGSVLANRIAHDEVVSVAGVGKLLLPAPRGFHTADGGYLINLSYSPPQVLARLRQQQPSAPWTEIARSLPRLLAAGAPSGWAMDWVRVGAQARPSPSPAPNMAGPGRQDAVAVGSYEAIREYLWLGMADAHTPSVHEGLAALPAMANYLDSNLLPPASVTSSGKVLWLDAPVGFSAAVIPYLQATGRTTVARAQQERLTANLQPDTGLYGRGMDYYDQNLALFATGWSERRFRFDREGRLEVRWKS